MKISEQCLACAREWIDPLDVAPDTYMVLDLRQIDRFHKIVRRFDASKNRDWEERCDDEQGATIMCFCAAIAESEGD